MQKNIKDILVIVLVSIMLPTQLLAVEILDSEKIIDLVRSRNKEIRKAEIESKIINLQKKIVISHALPHLSLSAEFARTNLLGEIVPGDTTMVPVIDTTTGQPTIYATPTAQVALGSNRLGNVFQTKAKAEWVLYSGGRFWAGLELSKLARNDSVYKIEEILDGGIHQALKAYNDVLLAQAALTVVKEGKKLADAHVHQVRNLFASGYASDLDVLTAESYALEMEPAIIEASNNVDLATDLLKMLIGLDFGTEVQLAAFGDEIVKTEMASTDELIEQANSRRPEIESLDVKNAMLKQQKKLATAAYLPSVALFGEYAIKYGTQFPPLHEDWINGWTLGIGASWTIFDGLKGAAERNKTELQEEQLRIGQLQLIDGIQLEVTEAHSRLDASRQMQAVRLEQIERAQKQLNVANRKFANGLASNIDVLDAQLGLTKARLDAEAAYRAVVANSLQLSYKTGVIQDLGKQ